MNVKTIVKNIINNSIRKSKVAMLHPGRCGSTVVGSLLNQHPNFYWSGEPFEKLMGQGPLEKEGVVKVIKEREQDKISKVYSFATKYPDGMHLSPDCIDKSIPEYIDLLSDLGYSKFILITRTNHLKRIVSIHCCSFCVYCCLSLFPVFHPYKMHACRFICALLLLFWSCAVRGKELSRK